MLESLSSLGFKIFFANIAIGYILFIIFMVLFLIFFIPGLMILGYSELEDDNKKAVKFFLIYLTSLIALTFLTGMELIPIELSVLGGVSLFAGPYLMGEERKEIWQKIKNTDYKKLVTRYVKLTLSIIGIFGGIVLVMAIIGV